jgi:hypothetical protein
LWESTLAAAAPVRRAYRRGNVAAPRDFFTRQLLRSHVGRRASPQIALLELLGQAGQPEVGDLGPSAAVDHDVGRLQIAVENPLLMSRRETGAKLPRDLDRLVLWKPADAA